VPRMPWRRLRPRPTGITSTCGRGADCWNNRGREAGSSPSTSPTPATQWPTSTMPPSARSCASASRTPADLITTSRGLDPVSSTSPRQTERVNSSRDRVPANRRWAPTSRTRSGEVSGAPPSLAERRVRLELALSHPGMPQLSWRLAQGLATWDRDDAGALQAATFPLSFQLSLVSAHAFTLPLQFSLAFPLYLSPFPFHFHLRPLSFNSRCRAAAESKCRLNVCSLRKAWPWYLTP
jgi:hypothetical protein